MVPLVDTVRAAGGAPWVQEKPEKLEPWAGGVHTREEQGGRHDIGPRVVPERAWDWKYSSIYTNCRW